MSYLQHWQEARCSLNLTFNRRTYSLCYNSEQYTVINTHHGLFQYNRLALGVSSAPGIFQQAMDSLLQGMAHIAAYMDDILVTGECEQEHLQKLETAGVRLKKSKCLL